MWSVALLLGAVTAQQLKLTGNHLKGGSKPLLAGAGADLRTINKERQVYAPDFPHTIQDNKVKWALSPVLLPPAPGPAQEYGDEYYYPYYYNTEQNAHLFYQSDPWAAYYQGLPSLAPGERFQGPREELPQHTGLYDGPINPEDNIIPDTPRIFIKNFH